MVENQ